MQHSQQYKFVYQPSSRFVFKVKNEDQDEVFMSAKCHLTLRANTAEDGGDLCSDYVWDLLSSNMLSAMMSVCCRDVFAPSIPVSQLTADLF